MWCVAPLEMNEGTHLGVRVQSALGCSAEKAPLRDPYAYLGGKGIAILRNNVRVRMDSPCSEKG